jgi:hypothetical protein
VGQFFRPSHNGFLLYRPLTTVGYAFALHQLFGYDASAYHAVQLSVHLVNALLVGAILQRLTNHPVAAGSGALLYAAMPGHVSSVYWMSTFTMSGTTLIVFAAVWAYLALRGWLQAIACTALQVIGLLASEHAVSLPLLLAVLAGREWRRNNRALVGPAVCVGLYLLAKLYYFMFQRRLVPGEGYAPHMNPIDWIGQLGRFTSAMHEGLFVLPLGARAHFVLGGLVLGLIGVALRRRRQSDAWNTVATGGLVLLVGLLPVLPLVRHSFDYFIGIAGLGAVFAGIGLARVVTSRGWVPLVATIAFATSMWNLVDAHVMPDANREAAQIRITAAWSARWVWSVEQAARDGTVAEVAVPRHGLTDLVFALGHAERLLLPRPVRVILYDNRPPEGGAERVVLSEPPAVVPADARLPGWQPRWDWLRDLAV